MRVKIMRILLIAVCMCILAGIGLLMGINIASKNVQAMQIELKNGVTESIATESLELAPGESVEYDISLSKDINSDFLLTLAFEEINDSPLKEYVRVELLVDGESLCDESLDTLLEGKNVVTEHQIRKSTPVIITVRYYIPQEVGNEAQLKTASFMLNVTATNK